jgi:hypothetical protein
MKKRPVHSITCIEGNEMMVASGGIILGQKKKGHLPFCGEI